jgi:hypothetical protein
MLSPQQMLTAMIDTLLASSGDVRQKALAQVRDCDDKQLRKLIVARLIAVLCDQDVQRSRQAATVLIGIGQPALSALLVAGIQSDAVPMRLRCLDVVERIAAELPEEERRKVFWDLEYAKGLLRDPITLWFAETLLAAKRGE